MGGAGLRHRIGRFRQGNLPVWKGSAVHSRRRPASRHPSGKRRTAPTLLVEVDKQNGHRDGDDNRSGRTHHGPRADAEDFVHPFLQPVDQLRVGGVTLVEQDHAKKPGRIRHLSPRRSESSAAGSAPSTCARGWRRRRWRPGPAGSLRWQRAGYKSR